MSGINGACDQPCELGRHHLPDCCNYIEVWQECPCPECAGRRAVEVEALLVRNGISRG